MDTQLQDGTGVLIDDRMPEWYKKGTISGSVNYPFFKLVRPPEDRAWDDLLPMFGATPAREPGLMELDMRGTGLTLVKLQTGKWDFSDAKSLVFFYKGLAYARLPLTIKGLLAARYPPDKLIPIPWQHAILDAGRTYDPKP